MAECAQGISDQPASGSGPDSEPCFKMQKWSAEVVLAHCSDDCARFADGFCDLPAVGSEPDSGSRLKMPDLVSCLDRKPGLEVIGYSSDRCAAWEGSQTIPQRKDILQATLARLMENTNISSMYRNSMAEEIWQILLKYDSNGIILSRQVDPNNVSSVQDEPPNREEDDEVVLEAICTACEGTFRLNDPTYWSIKAHDKLVDRFLQPKFKVRSGIKCQTCSIPELTLPICSMCSKQCRLDEMSESQRKRAVAKRKCIQCAQG